MNFFLRLSHLNSVQDCSLISYYSIGMFLNQISLFFFSPHSVVGAIGFNPVEHESYEPHLSIQISNCGGLEEFSSALFEQSKISFDDFVVQIETNPNLLTDPSLVIKIGDTYHKWDTAAPIIMSHVLYGRSLPLDLMEKLKEKSTFKRGKILV